MLTLTLTLTLAVVTETAAVLETILVTVAVVTMPTAMLRPVSPGLPPVQTKTLAALPKGNAISGGNAYVATCSRFGLP
jgi:hypothetical protein